MRAADASKKKQQPELIARLHFELARQFEYPLADLGRAAEEYQRAITLRPDHLPSLQGARRVALRQSNLTVALTLFESEIRLTGEPQRRAELLLEKADCLGQLGREAEVAKTLALAAELAPGHLGVEWASVVAEHRANNLGGVERALERMAQGVTEPRYRAVLLARRARLAEITQKDPRVAIELYRAALEVDPTATGVVSALERLYHTDGRWNELTEILRLAAEQASVAWRRGVVLQKLAHVLFDRLGQWEGGTAVLERAFADLPDDVGIAEELALAYERLGRSDALAATLERLYALISEPPARAGIAYRIGHLWATVLGDDKRAVTWLKRELERDPEHLESLDALATLYAKHDQWKPLAAIRLAEAENCQDVSRRADCFAEVANIMEQRLGDPDEAARLHARALAADPSYAPSFLALERLLLASGRYQELVELYERAAAGGATPEARVAYLFKVGRLHEEALGDARAALAAYERVSGAGAPQVEALHAMQRAAERGGLHAELVRVLDAEAGQTKDNARRLALMHRAADVLARDLDEIDGAVARWRKLLDTDAKYEPALVALTRCLGRAGRWDEWLGVQKRRLAVMPAGAARASIQYQVAWILEERLGRRADAITAYREVLTTQPDHQLAQLSLERLLALQERWQDLVEAYERAGSSSATTNPALAARRLTRAGELWEQRLGQSEQALAAFERALALAPDHRLAVEGRLRLLAHRHDAKALADALEADAATYSATPEGLLAGFREAEVRLDELGESERAIAALDRILQRQPKHLATLVGLELVQSVGRLWEPLAAVMTSQVAVLTDPVSRAAALLRLAKIYSNLGSKEQVDATLWAVLELDPSSVVALHQLERMALERGDAQQLGEIDSRLVSRCPDQREAAVHQTRLAELLEDQGDPQALGGFDAALNLDREDLVAARGLGRWAAARGDARRLEMAAEAELHITQDLETASGWWLAASEVYETAGDIGAAVAVVERSLAVHPDHEPSAERLTELRLARGEIDALIHTLSQAAGQARPPERAAQAWIRVARLLSDRKGDVAGAILTLGRCTTTLSKCGSIWLELAQLYSRDGQHAAAAERYKRALDVEVTPAESETARLALAVTLMEHLGNPDQALPHLEAVLLTSPNEPRALKALFNLRVARGELDRARELATQMVRSALTPVERGEALVGLAQIELKRGNSDEAVGVYLQAIGLQGVEGSAASSVVSLFASRARTGQAPDWGGYVAALTQYLEEVGRNATPPVLRAVRELARVLDQEVGQSDRAAELLDGWLQAAPDDMDLMGDLGGVLERAGQWGQAVDAHRRVLTVDVARVEAYRGIQRSYERLDRRYEALVCLAPLVVLGAATDTEAASVSARGPMAGQFAARSVDGDAISSFGAPLLSDSLGTLIAAMADGLDRADAPDIDRYGLSSRDRVGARSGNALRGVADRVAQVFDVDDFDFYVSDALTTVTLDAGAPPTLLVPASLAGASESVQAFVFARLFATFGRRWHAVMRFEGAELDGWIAAAVRLADSNYGVGTPDEETISVLAKRLAKALPWGRRGRVEEAASACMATGLTSSQQFVSQTRLAATRLALVLADDLVNVVTWIRRTEGDLSGLPGDRAQQGVALAQDLVRTWVQEPAFALRRRLGTG